MNSKNFTLYSALIVGACTILVAIVAQGQFPMGYDSDSNSDHGSELSRSELANIMRQSQRPMGGSSNHYNNGNQQVNAATRNLYNRQQPLQYAPSHNQGQNFGPTDGMSGYGPMMGAGSGRSNANNEDRDDDDGPSSFGPSGGFGPSSFGPSGDDDEGRGADGSAMNLNQAATGYPGQNMGNQGYGNDQSNLAAGFGPYDNSGEGAEYAGINNGFASQSRRSKAASSPMSLRNNREYDGNDDDAPVSRYGPNSASNSDRDPDDESRNSPDGGRDDNDDE